MVALQARGKLILVHGYCAGQNEFPLSDFTNAVQFQDYNQVRSNDAFALKIRDFGNQFESFSIVRSRPDTHPHTQPNGN